MTLHPSVHTLWYVKGLVKRVNFVSEFGYLLPIFTRERPKFVLDFFLTFFSTEGDHLYIFYKKQGPRTYVCLVSFESEPFPVF